MHLGRYSLIVPGFNFRDWMVWLGRISAWKLSSSPIVLLIRRPPRGLKPLRNHISHNRGEEKVLQIMGVCQPEHHRALLTGDSFPRRCTGRKSAADCPTTQPAVGLNAACIASATLPESTSKLIGLLLGAARSGTRQ